MLALRLAKRGARSALAVWMGGAFSIALGRDALANGRYPSAKHIVFDPMNADHWVATTTFGLLESRDRGRTFQWRCEAALGVAGDQDELVAISANGTVATALSTGLVTTGDGCTFRAAPELSGHYIADIALSRGAPHDFFAFHVDLSLTGQIDSQIVHSADDGKTWALVGTPFAPTVLPLTIDVAPSNPARVYVSARLGSADQYASVLLRSDDGGKTFQSLPIPETLEQREAFIAAVHPHDADRVFLRVEDSPGTVIWSTSDGGQHFDKRFTGVGQLLGFAMSPDGAQIAFGGPDDGIWSGAQDGAQDAATFTRVSDVRPTCLTWTADGIYACADQAVAPFSIGLSHDGAMTFASLVRFDALCGATGCPADAGDSIACAPAWESVAPALGATCMPDAGGASDAGPPIDAAGEAHVEDAHSEAHASDAGDVGTGGSPPTTHASCSCNFARSGAFQRVHIASVLALLLGTALRRGSKRKR